MKPPYPIWIDDARKAVDRLRDALGLITQADAEPSTWPCDWSDLLSPRAWTLQVASTQLSLARFYLGLATDQSRLA